MKKHVSLFLALLILVSVFFAVPAEAAEREQTKMEQPQVCVMSAPSAKEEAPSVTNLSQPSKDSENASGSGSAINASSACNHVYGRPISAGTQQHKRICTKCGHVQYYNHAVDHTTPTGNVHVKYCACGYYMGSENHTIKCRMVDSQKHEYYCTKCNHTTKENHKMTYYIVTETLPGTSVKMRYKYWFCTVAGCDRKYKEELIIY